jgi:origin recognition complex subunit 2
MKRKKQSRDLSNGLNDEPTPKNARTVSRALSHDEEDGENNLPRDITTKRRSSRHEEHERESAHDSARSASSPSEEEEDGYRSTSAEQREGYQDGGLIDGDATTPLKSQHDHTRNGINRRQGKGMTPIKAFEGTKLFSTPIKTNGSAEADETPTLARHADRSARKKTTRNLIERTVLGNTSDNEDEDEDIVNHIYDSDEGDEADQGIEAVEKGSESTPVTPARRGRPKGSKNKQRSPTPIYDLPPHEIYFSQNRGGHSKTSNNNLSSLALLDHEEYFTLLRNYKDPLKEDQDCLQRLYTFSFDQWRFELSQDFNLCLYGWGSKRSLLLNLAEYIYKTHQDHEKNKVVVVNGYVRNLTIRDVLNTIAGAISDTGIKMGSQPAEMLEKLLTALEEDNGKKITLVIHSIDGPALRRPATQTILSRLGSHPQIQLIASADHPSFPLLWDSSLRSTFNFVFHDCTTFEPYTAEVDVVGEVHELLGRSGRRVGGKDGVSFVLKSLPGNARNLFRVLIGEQLAAMDENLAGMFDDDDDYDDERHAGNTGRNEPGVEYKVLYQKACEEFICSNEMSFRTLLKE